MNEHESDILIAEPEEEVETEKYETPEQDSLFTYDFTKKSEPNKKVQKETDAFVNYNSNNLSKVYKKYDVVQTYVPKKKPQQKKESDFEKFVKEQDSYVPEKETLTVEKVEQKPKFKFKPKAKAWLISIIIIFAMLGGLSIYNAVHIQNLNNQLTETTVQSTNIGSDIKKVISSIDELTDEDNIMSKAQELGLKEVTEENKVEIELKPKNQVKDYESQTNFFDKICNFFRNLFGGWLTWKNQFSQHIQCKRDY